MDDLLYSQVRIRASQLADAAHLCYWFGSLKSNGYTAANNFHVKQLAEAWAELQKDMGTLVDAQAADDAKPAA